ncbi:glycoside hydrolase family 5 protein [Sphingomonas qilianensis]|uniref:Glycoside hydrolase family 5 protein n=1 Tax=Sphingomonas qilianensis TaxID=1736690 RepID=A0ABU9XP39_9SPHN
MSAARPGSGIVRWMIALLALLGGGALAAMMLQAPAPAAPAKGPPLVPRYAGVNLASGSFGTKALPGIYGHDYIYPNARDAAPFLAAGMTAIRLPFRWERVQPALGRPLDPAEMRRLDAAVMALSGFRMIILDLHNYAGYRGTKLGTPQFPGSALEDVWRQLAARYRSNPRIAFGMMNEPTGIDALAWRQIAESTLLAIRDTGARNLVLIPGTRWTGAHSWAKGTPSNAEALTGVRDPINNIAFEMHQYLDPNSSGTGATCVSAEAAAARLRVATAWLRAQKARGFLGEFGSPATPECHVALDALLTTMDNSDDVWLGWTYWAAGARWNKYALSVQPDANGPKPQMAILAKHLPK